MAVRDKELEETIEKVVAESCKRNFNGINDQLDEVRDELVEIKKLLAGDKKYNIVGMKQKQDEMWDNHLWWRESKADAKELLDSYKNWRWFFNGLDKWIAIIGVSTIISLVVSIINFFSLA